MMPSAARVFGVLAGLLAVAGCRGKPAPEALDAAPAIAPAASAEPRASSELATALAGLNLALVHCDGATARVEKVPGAALSDEPVAVGTARGGVALIVVTATRSDPAKVVVREHEPGGLWRMVQELPATNDELIGFRAIELIGRSGPSYPYLKMGRAIFERAGARWSRLELPSDRLFSCAANNGDLFCATKTGIHRRNGSAWEKEATPPGLEEPELFAGDRVVWAVDRANKILAMRATSGRWSVKRWRAHAELFVLPDGDLIASSESLAMRYAISRDAWQELPSVDAPILTMWGRNERDVYAIRQAGVVHFDGKKWSEMGCPYGTRAMTGTPTELLLFTSAFD